MDTYPIMIFEDRYMGAYSKGKWIAVAEADVDGRTEELCDGAAGDDPDAMEFWHDPPAWVAVGNTPNEALASLMQKAANA
jgi:hypothetical protein